MREKQPQISPRIRLVESANLCYLFHMSMEPEDEFDVIQSPSPKPAMNETKYEQPWIGVDLDGTLAYYDNWRGVDHIGMPIMPMLSRVKAWIDEGKRVKIFTARVSRGGDEGMRAHDCIKDWLKKFGLPDLEVTCVKDFAMVELWDDRCVQVVTNTGLSIRETVEAHIEQHQKSCNYCGQ